MDAEGRGTVPPSPIKIRLDESEVRLLLALARQRNNYRSYGAKSSRWKQGLHKCGEHLIGIGDVEKPVLPILIGMVGEYGASRYINAAMGRSVCELDDVDRPRGDDGADLLPCGFRLQVKTRRTHSTNLIRRVSDQKRLVPINADAAIFCQWRGQATVELLGWQYAAAIRELGVFEKSHRADHWNLVLKDAALKPLGDLIAKLRVLDAGNKNAG